MGEDAHTGKSGNRNAEQEPRTTDLDIEMALLTLSAHDMGEPTEDLDLAALTPNEKRVLLDLLRKRLGDVPTAAPHPADTVISDTISSGGQEKQGRDA